MFRLDVIAWIDEVDNDDIELVGGKGASLGEMKKAGLPVPNAFVVTAGTFRKYIEGTGIKDEIFEILDNTEVDDSKMLRKSSEKIKNIILKTDMPEKFRDEIFLAYEEISKDADDKEEFVAIRSSATAEDLPDASFAGQQETFLNVKSKEQVLKMIKKCWASLYTGRAIFYREKQDFDHHDVNIAVIVQKMINAEKAGVIFTSHPTTGRDEVIIESGWGLGEGVVSGSVSPDQYIARKDTLDIERKEVSTKNTMYVRDPETGETEKIEVPEDKKNLSTLSDSEIKRLVKLADRVEEHYNSPQDVEWAIKDGEVFMLQSRPITTISEDRENIEEMSGEVILEGLGASPGAGTGKVRIVKTLDEIDKIIEGDILVTSMTTPDMVPAMRKASAIITEEGGMTCHAAIVSRELGTPAVVGSENACQILEDDMIVTVDGERGKVMKGDTRKSVDEEKVEKEVVRKRPREITATDIKVNVSMPAAAERAAKTGADGVGLLRIEHLVLGLNKHPQAYVDDGEEEKFIEELFNGIAKVADEFYPRPVWVRTLDAPTDEFRSLEGGGREPKESNPMMGFRGIRRDLQFEDSFLMQIKAIKKVIEKGYVNVGIMLPLVQHPSEVSKARKLAEENGLDINKLTFGIMVETPASAIMIEDFLDEDIDFVSFGTNDLTQYTLAVDRNNNKVSSIYDEKHPAVMHLMRKVIERCREKGIECSICGQAGSRPEIVRKLVEHGISSVSANIDAVDEITRVVAKKEKQIMLDSSR